MKKLELKIGSIYLDLETRKVFYIVNNSFGDYETSDCFTLSSDVPYKLIEITKDNIKNYPEAWEFIMKEFKRSY